jgi:A/G-specific adenine glycosylase
MVLMGKKDTEINSDNFQKSVLTWFDNHGRKDLPWQHNKTPYRVWVSEIMLQQTQVTTVIPYYLRFMEHFPDISSLAKASEDEVLHLWTGLGYYSRARNLHRTAKIIASNGQFPDELSELEKLPGIGLSTAGAILAIAFEKKATILDGNVKRVLTRSHGISEWPGAKKISDQLWEIAEKLTPNERVADYTQAIMDLGATICVRGKPHCETCPLEKMCVAHSQGIEAKLPQSKPRKSLPIRQATLLILQNNNQIFLEKRPPAGIWGGLWSLPEISGHVALHEIKKICAERFKFEMIELKLKECFRHTFSHFHLDIIPAVVVIKRTKLKVMEDGQQIWYNLRDPAVVGLPAPVKKLLSGI